MAVCKIDSQRNSSSTAGPTASGILPHRRQLIGVPQQGQRAQPQHVRRRFVPGQQKQARDADELVVGQLLAVLADQHAQHVLAGFAPGRRHQRAHVVAALTLQLQPLGDGSGQVELARGAPLEVFAVGIGHAEQLTDHQRRNRQREVCHQIRRRTLAFHSVELLLDDLDDPRLQPLHPPDGELAGEHAAQPLMFGWVEAEQVARPGFGLLVFRHGGRAGQHEPGRTAVAEMFVVGQYLFDVLVPGDEVHLHPEGVDHRAHAGRFPDLAEFGRRVEGVATHV